MTRPRPARAGSAAAISLFAAAVITLAACAGSGGPTRASGPRRSSTSTAPATTLPSTSTPSVPVGPMGGGPGVNVYAQTAADANGKEAARTRARDRHDIHRHLARRITLPQHHLELARG